MSARIFCLTASGGIPIFSRFSENLKPLPYPVIGSLNGVRIFADSSGIDLHSSKTDGTCLYWKVNHDSLVFIIMTEDGGCTSDHSYYSRLLDYQFNTILLLRGLPDLIAIKNVEKFKRDVKVCFPLIDRLLEQLKSPISVPFLTCTPEIMLSTEASGLQNYVDAFADAASTPYACLMAADRVVVATQQWWSLHSTEQVLLSEFAICLSSHSTPANIHDIPVFLPVHSPQVPHRFILFRLVAEVKICLLCGPSPSLSDLEREVYRFWSSSYDSLRSFTYNSPNGFPSSISLDPNILSILIVNNKLKRSFSSTPTRSHISKSDRLLSKADELNKKKVLLKFVKKTCQNLSSEMENDLEDEEHDSLNKLNCNYICTKSNKFFLLSEDPYQIFILFSLEIPTYAMKNTAEKTLQKFIKEKYQL